MVKILNNDTYICVENLKFEETINEYLYRFATSYNIVCTYVQIVPAMINRESTTQSYLAITRFKKMQ